MLARRLRQKVQFCSISLPPTAAGAGQTLGG